MNTYRVISMSLAISLFFAAPLLCIQPISVQLDKGRSLTAKKSQTERESIAQTRSTYPSLTRSKARSAAWARAAHGVVTAGHEALLGGEEQITTPTLLPDEEDYSWSDDQSQNWDDAVAPAGTDEAEVIASTVVNEM